jgi:hypothetical protein
VAIRKLQQIHAVRQILEQLRTSPGEIEIGCLWLPWPNSVHGVYRARTPQQQQGRFAFIERLCEDVPVHPVTLEVARLAGRIEGQQDLQFEDTLRRK